MTSSSWIFSSHSSTSGPAGELITDYRSRLALEQSQAAEHRQQELAEQTSEFNAPEARIRAWEKTHGLRLPRESTHSVLRVVATLTHLTLEQVHEEQRRRSALAAPQAQAPQTAA
ncbi:MAG: hypothetical protein JWM63_2152 [Gammaproteobacteria bacterium]|jgi:hypothetical protein|nr:hypothetical protein [Gammaproteobacteria bacterium]